ncbi:MAG: hypothetical protein AMXMBFR82_42270 [Candidatus Hydrogenedentota bacterium]
MQIRVSIPDELHEAAEREAEKLGVSRNQFFQRALEAYLKQPDEDAITKSLNRVYSDDDPGRLDPVLSRMQWSMLKLRPW